MLGAKVANFAHLCSVLSKEVRRNDEIEAAINCSPAYELNEELERRL